MNEDLYLRLESLSKCLESSGLIDEHHTPDAYATILDAMNAVLHACSEAKDAARYRWIRVTDSWFKEQGMGPEEIDAAIDAAMVSHPPVHSTGGQS